MSELINSMNRSGPSIDPLGAPEKTNNWASPESLWKKYFLRIFYEIGSK